MAGDVGEAAEVEPRRRRLRRDGVQVPSVLLELSCGLLPMLDWRGGAHGPVQGSRCLWVGGGAPPRGGGGGRPPRGGGGGGGAPRGARTGRHWCPPAGSRSP